MAEKGEKLKNFISILEAHCLAWGWLFIISASSGCN